jgi:hypothetical protein
MIRKRRKQVVSLILAFSLLLPMAVGLSHALHEHDNKVCLAENESHIHSQGVSCEHMHYFNPAGTFDPIDISPLLLFDPIDSRSFEELGKKRNSHFNTFELRGPPSINV